MAALTEEQSLIRDQAKSWATEKAPVGSFRKMRDSGIPERFEGQTWESMIEMGWTGILIPETYGGSDLGYLTFGVVLEELGRQLTASPLLASSLVGTSAILLGGNEEQKQAYLPKLIDGSEILTLAVDEGPRHDPVKTALAANKTASGYELSGTKFMVLEGMAATTFVVVARSSGAAGESQGLSLFLVPANAQGVSREAVHTMDNRGYATVQLNGVSVANEALLGAADEGNQLLEAVLDRGRAGLGAEMIGTASQAFEMTLEYLKTREQFGRVIGSFQALGHRAAELYSGMELARSCAESALQALDAGAEGVALAELSSLSKCRVGEYLHSMSNQLIQIHGGIGMTDEFDAGLYLKRARALETIYGNRSFHRDRYARALGF